MKKKLTIETQDKLTNHRSLNQAQCCYTIIKSGANGDKNKMFVISH